MEQFENQMDCVIIEAFPKYDLEEIQNWSMDKTMMYYSRAEWILANIRGIPIAIQGMDDIGDFDAPITEGEIIED